MRDPPDIATLLQLAEAAPDDPLAARCRAIAVREAAGEGAYAAVRQALRALYGDASDAELLAHLAADIRAGRFDADGPERRCVERLLRSLAQQKLRENNPDFLGGATIPAKM